MNIERTRQATESMRETLTFSILIPRVCTLTPLWCPCNYNQPYPSHDGLRKTLRLPKCLLRRVTAIDLSERRVSSQEPATHLKRLATRLLDMRNGVDESLCTHGDDATTTTRPA